MARPRIEIDWKKVESMCAIHCTQAEIAAILDIDIETLVDACERDNGVSFSVFYAKKASGGKMSLRRKQYTQAMEGNVTMQIWLGKQWLGQSDKMESKQEITGANGQPIATVNLPADPIEASKAYQDFMKKK